MPQERFDTSKYQDPKLRAEIADKTLASIIEAGADENKVGEAQAAIRTVKIPSTTPDLNLDPARLQVTLEELQNRESAGLLSPELKQDLSIILRKQQEISLNRPPTFAQRLIQNSKDILNGFGTPTSNLSFGGELTDFGSRMIRMNIYVGSSTLIGSGFHFALGNYDIAQAFLAWAIGQAVTAAVTAVVCRR